MNTMLKSILHSVRMAAAAAVGVLCVPQAHGENGPDNKKIIDDITAQLASKATAADSLPLMLDIFDLSDNHSRLETAEAALETAARAGNVPVQLDMMRNVATVAGTRKDEDKVRALLERVQQLPESEDRRQTEVYIRSRLAGARVFKSEAERDEYLREVISDFNDMDGDADIYERVAKLFTLVHVLGGYTHGSLIDDYVTQLEDLLGRLPKEPTQYLQSSFYTSAAILYWYNDQPEKSIEADRFLLRLMRELSEYYPQNGRRYRDYALQEYVSLRRILRHYDSLSDEDFNTYYNRVMEIAETNADVRRDLDTNPTVAMARLLKDGEYAAAIPLIRQLAEHEKGINDRRFVLRLLASTAEKAGDHNLMLRTKAEYADLLEEFIDYRSGERMRELQIIYDVNALKQTASANELARQNARTALYVGAAIIALVLLVVFVVLYLRFRSLLTRIRAANKSLEQERATLLASGQQLMQARDKLRQTELEKSQLITYLGNELAVPLNAITQYTQMIIDAVPDDGDNAYLQRFLAVVRANSRILQEIASDVQEFSLMESHTLSVHSVPLSANGIAEMAIDSVRPLSKPEIELIFEPARTDNDIINTDGRRVVPAITALLTNAIKFTEEGSVTLKVDIDREAGKVTYTVTDTGIGVPPDKADVIFERFSRLNPDRPGIGIGLSNCALIARTLGGGVRLDTTWPGPGARFVLTIPVEI